MQEEIVSVQGLKKRYGDVQALGGISFTVRRGSLFSFLGVNGAGKSTAINILCSILQKDGGAVSVCGFDLDTQAEEIKKRVGVVFQATVLDDLLTVKDNLVTRAAFYGLRGAALRERLRRLCGLLELDDIFNRPFGKLSGGQRRRADIARGLLNDPELLILDEPVNGLDPIGIAEMRDFIRRLCKEQGKTVLLSSHILSEVALLADDVGIIDHGRLLEEESMAVLEKKNRQYIRLGVSDAAQAAHLLEDTLGMRDFTAEDDHTLCIYDLRLDPARLAQVLQEQGIALSELHRCQDTLENYFKRVTGGAGLG